MIMQGREIYVSLNGNDFNPGTPNMPLATLEGAKNLIEKKYKNSKVIVYFSEGEYFFDETVEISGSNIEILQKENENVKFTGAKKIDLSKAYYVSDEQILNKLPHGSKDKVLEIDLKVQGIFGLGNINKISYWKEKQPMTALCFNGKPLKRARWPKNDFAKIGTVVEDTSGGHIFKFDDERIKNWKNADECWLCGYWKYLWALDSLNIKYVDLKNMTISTKEAASFGIEEGRPFYIFNILEELSEEGEFYIDSKTEILYFYPPKKIESTDILTASFLETPIILLKESQNCRISGIHFNSGKKCGVEMSGGRNNKIENCIFTDFGMNAVNIIDEFKSGVEKCEIYNMGGGGIKIFSGDRELLRSAYCYATENIIHDYANDFPVYEAAVDLKGVGNIAARNMIYSAPHVGILFAGNDHIIEYNEIYNILRESSDAGAIYGGRDWSARGNIIRYNYLHDFKGIGDNGIIGIYLDDGFSDAHIYGNVMKNMDFGILIGGGRCNLVENNVIMDKTESSTRSIWADARGVEWERFYGMFHDEDSELFQKIRNVPFTSEAWSKYPHMKDILSDMPAVPKYNIIRNNLIINHKPLEISPDFEKNSEVYDNLFI